MTFYLDRGHLYMYFTFIEIKSEFIKELLTFDLKFIFNFF